MTTKTALMLQEAYEAMIKCVLVCLSFPTFNATDRELLELLENQV